jgi:hypothetical protein
MILTVLRGRRAPSFRPVVEGDTAWLDEDAGWDKVLEGELVAVAGGLLNSGGGGGRNDVESPQPVAKRTAARPTTVILSQHATMTCPTLVFNGVTLSLTNKC